MGRYNLVGEVVAHFEILGVGSLLKCAIARVGLTFLHIYPVHKYSIFKLSKSLHGFTFATVTKNHHIRRLLYLDEVFVTLDTILYLGEHPSILLATVTSDTTHLQLGQRLIFEQRLVHSC